MQNFVILSLLFGFLLSNGCISEQTGNQMMSQMFMTDLSVPSLTYRTEKGHWPKDYSELSEFVQQSGGQLRRYDRVEFTELPGDTFHVSAVADGFTNQFTVTYSPSYQKN
jgi:hypothetical protein